jgi:hypothetical protein
VRQASAGKQSPWINASLSSDVYFVSDDIRAARAAEAAKAQAAADAARRADLDKALAAQKASADKAKAEAEAAKAVAAEAQAQAAAVKAAAEAERSRPKGKVRIESTATGKVFMGAELLGDVSPGAPLQADSLPTGSQVFRFARQGAADETKTATITDKAYVTVAFGPAVAGMVAANSPPGAIAVRCFVGGPWKDDGSVVLNASLDGGDLVELPHTFEGVQPGAHTIKVPDFSIGTKAYRGIEESVVVEPGKRLEYSPILEPGQAKLVVTDIPAGSTLLLDGIELAPLMPAPDGTLVFEGNVDAGSPEIYAVNGNKAWRIRSNLVIDSSVEYSCKASMRFEYTVPRKDIRMKGMDEDWKDLDRIYGALGSMPKEEIPGSRITGGYVCRDDKNLFIRIDYSNGAPKSSGCGLFLAFNRVVCLNYSIWKDGTRHSCITKRGIKEAIQCGKYRIEDSFLELQFPISTIARYIDLSKPISSNLAFYSESLPNIAFISPYVDIIVGK